MRRKYTAEETLHDKMAAATLGISLAYYRKAYGNPARDAAEQAEKKRRVSFEKPSVVLEGSFTFSSMEESPHIRTYGFDIKGWPDDRDDDDGVSIGYMSAYWFDLEAPNLWDEADALSGDAEHYVSDLSDFAERQGSFKPGFAVIDRLEIEPNYRNKGFGGAALDLLSERLLKTSSFVAVLPHSEEVTIDLPSFYMWHGFTETVGAMFVKMEEE